MASGPYGPLFLLASVLLAVRRRSPTVSSGRGLIEPDELASVVVLRVRQRAERDKRIISAASPARCLVVSFHPALALVNASGLAKGINHHPAERAADQATDPLVMAGAGDGRILFRGHHAGACAAFRNHARTVWRCSKLVSIRSHASALSGSVSSSFLEAMPSTSLRVRLAASGVGWCPPIS